MFFVLPLAGWASGPRYVTGRPFFTGNQGQPVVWKQSTLLYSTDPGSLSPSVNHAAADALVAAAAGVWNVPVASITVGNGGKLAEHVSGNNTYLGTNGMVWPADVASSNAAAIPIAVVYDTDGSVTDLLLGAGASDPSSCRQNGVSESVDAFDPAGYILHAIIVVNGRCTGAAAAAQSQLQYQLERVFGRVLGLAWSQANDNVFTGTPTPTYDQAMHWPIMHPLDIICGTYTYQCLPSPFTLRPDDIAALVLLYPNVQGAALAAGKQVSLAAAEGVFGEVDFPTGQGMAGVNVLAQRQSSATNALEGWVEASAVTGTLHRRNGTSPFVAADNTVIGSEGTNDQSLMGRYLVAYLPLQTGTTQQTVVVSTERVNALYTGTHSVEPYAAGIVTPSGSAPAPVWYPQATSNGDAYGFFTIADASSVCGSGLDGTAATPVPADASGWWNGLICGYGHASYLTLDVRPSRSLTVQVTGLDENGFATTGKMMPAIGVYAPTDAPTALPSVAVQAGAFNALGLGTTTLTAATGSLTQLRIGIADQRGDGRPDFAFQGRIFYADSILPERLPPAGGAVTISGMGFRIGNQVRVNGVLAAVTSWSSTSLSVTVPPMTAVGAVDQVAVDVVANDVSTGAVSTMTGALTFDSSPVLPNSMKLVSAPVGTMVVGSAATPAFAVQILKGDGVTPVAAEPVSFTVTGGTAVFSACAAAACTVTTDASGMASTSVTPGGAGTLTVRASDGGLTQTVSFSAAAGDGSMRVTSAPPSRVPNGTAAATPFAVRVLEADGKTAASGRMVTFTVTGGSATYGACSNASCAVQTDGNGAASAMVTPAAVGTVTLKATDGGVSQTATFTSTDNTDTLQVTSLPAATALIGQAPAFAVRLLHADGVTGDAGEMVAFNATGGAILYPCGTAACAVKTGSDGSASVNVSMQTTGSTTVQASFGKLTQAATVAYAQQSSQMQLLSAPSGTQVVGKTTTQPFSVRMVDPNGNPMSGVSLPMTGPLDQQTLGACGRGGCLLVIDGNGVATSTVTPLRAGTILLTAQYGTLSQTISFTAVGGVKTMTVLSQPGAGTATGDLESFVVQVIEADGVTPAANEFVTFSVTGGSFAFHGCPSAPCYVLTDANGKAAVSGVALAPGAITVLAADDAANQSMSFSTAVRTDLIRSTSTPGSSVYVGAASTSSFAVRVTQADGTTPAAGVTVAFTNGGTGAGLVQFTACGGAVCTVATDQNGAASTGVMGQTAGAATLVAGLSSSLGGASVSAGLQVVADQESLNAANPAIYVAEQASFNEVLTVMATLNGSPANGTAVSWTAKGAVTLAAGSSTTDASGGARVQANWGPLAAGATAEADACAWTIVCAPFEAYGVASSALTLTVVSGATQTLASGGVPVPVVAMVNDAAGHAVAGAMVTVYQTVSAGSTPCPATGRCPAAPVLATEVDTLTSDGNGLVSQNPKTIGGTATETKLLLTVGTQGSATAEVWSPL